jgi:molybdopterin-binding protein
VNEKPHNTVINRIQQNETIIQKGKKEKASVVQERVKSIPEGKVNREVRIEAPKGTNYIVPASQVNRPKSEMKLQQKEIKTSGKPGQQEKPGKPEQPSAGRERVMPAKPAEKGVDKSKKVEKPESATKESKPPEKAIEKPKVKPPEKAVEKPKVKPPEKVIEKPKKVKPPERAIEKPKVKPPEKDLEKQKELKPSEKDLEKRRERKPPEEEGEKPR